MGTPIWYCAPPGALSPPCPPLIPNDGAACEVASSVECPHGICGGLNVACSDGSWRWTYASTMTCGVCASPDTPIATPYGERPIASLRAGELVYSANHGALEPVILLRVTRTPVANHHVVRVTIANGRKLEISPGHPTADGRFFGELASGALLDGQAIAEIELVPYGYSETYDILPASDSGTYVAAGVLIGSTLHGRLEVDATISSELTP